MRFGITAKLFLALLATSLVVAVSMAVVMRLSFQHGFREYLAEQEQQRLAVLSAVLVEAYREHGGWRFLRENPGEWRRLLRFASRQVLADAEHGRPDGPPIGIVPRLSLLDATGELVVGRGEHGEDARLYPVVDQSETVGWLAVAPFRRPANRADLHFQEQQLAGGLISAGLALLLAAGVAVVLAWRMLVPVRQLATATHKLAAGDYRTRVPVGNRDEIGRLARDFNQLAATLERNEQLRRAFMADVSHELRTPLAVLRGELEALEDGVRPMTPGSLRSLQSEVNALSKLVDDVYELALADVGALAYHKTDVDLSDLLRTVLTSFERRLANRRLTLRAELPAKPLFMLGDGARLTQLFNNLLENTLRYTDPGGTVRMRADRANSKAVLLLEDSAPGVPAERVERLFERFYRPDAGRSRAHGGAGLGLAICRRIVDAHGGSIEAAPSSIGGLRITIHLPLKGKHA